MGDIAVVIATHDRHALLGALLASLADQTAPSDRYEVIVVDDGSRPPYVVERAYPYALRMIRQKNQGPAVARHRGILEAKSPIVLIVDDDMRVERGFIEAHLRAHERGASVVLGRIVEEEDADMPVLHRFHARVMDRYARVFEQGERPRGVHVCTGNVSFRRAAYLEIGGFDPSLARSEDRDLGLRLERAGAELAFEPRARAYNRSDVRDERVWRARNFDYGVSDLRISKKHPSVAYASPFAFFGIAHAMAAPFFALAIAAPNVSKRVASAALLVSRALDRAGAERAAIAGAGLAYGIEYFRGVRHESGSLREAARGFRRWTAS